MLSNPKNAIWEAFLLTGVVFVIGLLLGISYENGKIDQINEYYADSEISLTDIMAMNKIIDTKNLSCEVLIDSNLGFADKIYEEVRLLEKYEDSGKISDGMKLAHKKYDLLRTFLWVNSGETLKRCRNFSVVVYLYEYESDDLIQKANQNVWSKVLYDLKQDVGRDIILIPIAVDSNLTSLNSLVGRFDIESFPAVIINDKNVLTKLSSVEEIKKYL